MVPPTQSCSPSFHSIGVIPQKAIHTPNSNSEENSSSSWKTQLSPPAHPTGISNLSHPNPTPPTNYHTHTHTHTSLEPPAHPTGISDLSHPNPTPRLLPHTHISQMSAPPDFQGSDLLVTHTSTLCMLWMPLFPYPPHPFTPIPWRSAKDRDSFVSSPFLL